MIRRGNVKIYFSCFFAISGFLIFFSVSHAEPIQIYKPFEKLARGIVNIVTAPKEIPVQILASAWSREINIKIILLL